MLRFFIIASLLLGTSCTVADLTEVVVIVEAEPGLRAQSKSSLSVKVTTVPGPDDGPSVPLHDNDHTPWHGDEYTIALSPENPRGGSRYRVEASVLVNDQPIATARLISGFVAGQTRYVRMLLEEQCLGVSCAPDATCHLGVCVGADIDPTRFSPSSELAPTSTTLPSSTTDQPALDAGVQGGPGPVQTSGTDAAPARGTDAGKAAATDAGRTTATDAARATATDAGPDTRGPGTVDAGGATTAARADAEVTASVPDAAKPAPDAGVPGTPEGMLCRPGYYQGAFMGDYSYTLFGMTADIKITPVSTNNSPVLSLVLAADPADGPSKLRVRAGCMSGTMMAPPSNRPFVARLAGTLDCATGQLTGRLAGVYYLINNTDLDYPFTGAISAQFEAAGSSLVSGAWDAVEPKDPANANSGGMGQGSWTAAWTSDVAPSVGVDPCVDVLAAP